ncbi:MAG: Ldh family oxidoreductase [Chloroflexi bacterium]|nr:MAG: Ldh family oxidoreductase [Chloroflexota bacterium]
MARIARKTLTYSRSYSSGNWVAGSRSREPRWASSVGMAIPQCEWLTCHVSSTNNPIWVPSCPRRAPRMSPYPPDALRRYTAHALASLDVPEPDAALVADSLVEAELEGQATHGLLRLPFLLDRLRAGLINPRPSFRVIGDRAAAALLDADNGLGPVAGMRATELAVSRAAAAGAGIVAVRVHERAAGHVPAGRQHAVPGHQPDRGGLPDDRRPGDRGHGDEPGGAGPHPQGGAGARADPGGLGGGRGGPADDRPGGGDGRPAAPARRREGVRPGAAGGGAERRPGRRGGGARVAADVRRLGGRAPGDRRHAERARRLSEGVALPAQLVADLRERVGSEP